MKKRNPRKSKAKKASLADALNAMLKGEVSPSTAKKAGVKPEDLAQRAAEQKRFETDDDMEDAFDEVFSSGALAATDYDDEDDDYDEESEDELYEYYDEDDDLISGRDLIAPPVEGGRQGERRRGLEKYDREWTDDEFDVDRFDRQNNPSWMTPTTIGVSVAMIGLVGYFGYKHFFSDNK